LLNRGKLLRSPVNIKEATKPAKIYVGTEDLDPAHLLFSDHRLCMNYIIAMLVTSMLLYFDRVCAGSTPKIANKNMQQGILPGFITIPSIDYG